MAYYLQGGNPTEYVLGRGKLYLTNELGRFVSPLSTTRGPDTTAWRDIGNVTAFTLTQERETKEHKSMLSGLQTIDLSLSVSQKFNVSFTCDEISVNNLAMFLSGEVYNAASGGSFINAAGPASNDATAIGLLGGNSSHYNMFWTTNANDVLFDIWYDIQLTVNGTPYRAYDFSPQVSQAITVKKQSTTNAGSDGTTLTEGTHYVIDRRMGMIKLLNAGGGVARGNTIWVGWAASPDATKADGGLAGFDSQMSRINLLTTSGRSLGLKFVLENPNNSDNQAELVIWRIKLQPDGEFGGISDDWVGLSFSGSAESYDGTIPVGASKYGMFNRRSVYNT